MANTTWSDVDKTIEHYITHHKFNTNISHNERRQTALITALNYLYENYQSCIDDENNNKDIINCKIVAKAIRKCGKRMFRYINSLVREHTEMVEKKKNFCSKNQKYCFDDVTEKMYDRFMEHTDPEMEIWRRLQKEDCVNRDIEIEMKRVQHLLPKRIPIYNDKRTGFIATSINNTIAGNSKPNSEIRDKYWEDDTAMRLCCDDISIECNEISKLFCKSLVYDRNRRIKIPQYLKPLHVQCVEHACFPNNCFKLLVMLYNLFSPVAGSYIAIQCFVSSIKKALALAAKNKKTIVQATSILESLSGKTPLSLSSVVVAERLNIFGSIVDEPLQIKNTKSNKLDGVATVILQKNERCILFMLCGKIAEMDTNHPYLQLLTSCFSHVLGRSVTPNYILILLLNYIYKKSDNPIYHKHLSVLSFKVGLCVNNGVLVPLCGFGSGITERKFRRLACRFVKIIGHNYYDIDKTNILHLIKDDIEAATAEELLPSSSQLSLKEDTSCIIDESKEKRIAGIIENFFEGLSISEPNEVEEEQQQQYNESQKEEEKKEEDNSSGEIDKRQCGCSCHIVEDLKGKIIHPCKRRREIKEEIYERSLNLKPSLSLTFGVCGYKYLLNNISNARLDHLVQRQKLKERKTFIERESASKTSWYNLIQYMFRENSDGKIILSDMCRRRVCRISKFMVQCEYLSDIIRNLEFKFNSSLLPLGYKENIFMRLKSGIDIAVHAANCWRQVCLHRGWIDEAASGDAPPDWTLMYARKCYEKHDAKSAESERDRPFIEQWQRRRQQQHHHDEKLQCQFPYRGVDPIIGNEIFFKSKTFQDSLTGAFWAECSYDSLVDALRMKKLVSENDKHLAGLESLAKSTNYSNIFEKLVWKMKYKYDRDTLNVREKNDISRWSRKNSGIHGKKSIEFDVNSLIVIEDTLFDGKPCFFFLIDSQKIAIKRNIDFITIENLKRKKGGEHDDKKDEISRPFVRAPYISPLYKSITKPIPITVKSRI